MTATLSPFAEAIYRQKYSLNGEEQWEDTALRVASNVLGALGYNAGSEEVAETTYLIAERKFLPGGRYLYASGRSLHQVQNCLLLRAEDSREGWGDLWQKAGLALMTGAGIGVEYSEVREEGRPVSRTGGFASGPLSLMQSVNEIGRQVMQGGSRRSAIWAGLAWDHPDVFKFIRVKDWSPEMRALKEQDFTFPLPMELTNVSVSLDDAFFSAYHDEDNDMHEWAHNVYWKVVEKMVVTGEPGFSVNTGGNAGEDLRNACTEVTSRDDSDICNLGSINLARIESKSELAYVTELATLFLVAGTVYSDVPYEKVGHVRTKNRRLGLGVMGVHEWLLLRGKAYGADPELGSWLSVWAGQADHTARVTADQHGLSRPLKTRAIAPTGTIGIIAETTTGIEPVFCKAFKRRYLNGTTWQHQYVIDPTVARLEAEGVDPDTVEDAYMLALETDRRLEMQRFVQQHVDHGISSTVNLPYPMTDEREQLEFGEQLLTVLPDLRGITCYPNGARGGQPLEAVGYDFAKRQEGLVFESSEETCVGGVCGT